MLQVVTWLCPTVKFNAVYLRSAEVGHDVKFKASFLAAKEAAGGMFHTACFEITANEMKPNVGPHDREGISLSLCVCARACMSGCLSIPSEICART